MTLTGMPINAYPTATQIVHVDHTGTMLAGPVSWTAELVSSGHFKIHHQIGDELYTVQVQPLVQPDNGPVVAVVTEEKAGYLCYEVYAPDGKTKSPDCQLIVTI